MEERRKRKKSIVIRGVRTSGRGVKDEIKNLIKETMGLSVYIKKVRPIGGGLVVELESMENKREIMKNKKWLKGWDIWIDDDLTEREKEIQSWLERLVEEERKRGIEARIGYQRVQVKGEWYRWEEKRGGLEEMEDRTFRGRETN